MIDLRNEFNNYINSKFLGLIFFIMMIKMKLLSLFFIFNNVLILKIKSGNILKFWWCNWSIMLEYIIIIVMKFKMDVKFVIFFYYYLIN